MKILRFLCTLITGALILSSCAKELSQETSLSSGSIVKDSNGDCLPVNIVGNFVANTQLTNASYVEVQVTFTDKGQYNIQTSTVNGYFFKSGGTIDEIGTKTIRLQAAGKPLAVGNDVFTLRFGTDSCQFVIPVTAAPAPQPGPNAVFSFVTTGANCSATINGTYQANLPTTGSNTISLAVNTTTPGSYNISSAPINGVVFSGQGTLAAGNGNIILTASGTPTAAGSFDYSTSGIGTNSCTFAVVYTAAAPPAVYTAVCATATTVGTYTVGTAGTTANRIIIPVNVTTAGSYSVTTGSPAGTAVNGLVFSASGVFAAAGPNTIELVLGATNNTPTTAGSTVIPFTLNGAACSVTLNVQAGTGGGGSTSFLRCSVNGGALTNFPLNLEGSTITFGGIVLDVEVLGEVNASTSEEISVGVGDFAAIVPGVFNVTDISSGSLRSAYCRYVNAGGTVFEVNQNSAPFPTNPLFSVTITSLTATRVIGTFSGKVGTSTSFVTITNGSFDVTF
jgi:hypothetical protein